MSHEGKIITSHLTDYCSEQNIHCLAARDYGSRARNLENSESDYDIMFVFTHEPEAYATGVATEHYGKTIPPDENELDTEIEFDGWDLRKFIGNDGCAGSNPTAVEFCATDEIYVEGSETFREICQHTLAHFKPYALINHYRSLAASNYGKYIEGDYKLASDTSWAELYRDQIDSFPGKHVADNAIENALVDEAESEITDHVVNIVGETEVSFGAGTIDLDEAEERGLIEPTTTEQTVKRYLNVMQALTKARYIEETTAVPEMDYTEFLREIAGSDWLPEHVYAEIGALIAEKTSNTGSPGPRDTLDDWIEAELDREIDPGPYVQTQPDTETIRELAQDLYREVVL